MDLNGHGTHVGGTVAAVGGNFLGISGVAPKAKIFPVKVFGPDGSATSVDIARGFREALLLGFRVSNHSYGGPGDDLLLKNLFEIANRQGMVSIAAAGNDIDFSANYHPGNFSSVITVAACTPSFKRAFFSNFGDNVTVCAPGGGDFDSPGGSSNILSTMSSGSVIARETPLIRVFTESNSPFGYYRLAGTSMAAPHAAGVAALMLAINPRLTPEDVRGSLQFTSQKNIISEVMVGGMLDADAATSLTVPLPVARIFQKDSDAFRRGGIMDLVGSAYGLSFTSYRLDYAVADAPNTWINLTSSTSPVFNGVLLSRFNSVIGIDEDVTIRLRVFDNLGRFVEDYKSFTIPNLKITFPGNYDSINAFDRIPIRANLKNPNLISYSLEQTDSRKIGISNSWSRKGIISTNTKVREDDTVIGYLNSSELTPDKFYALKLVVTLRSGRTKTTYLRHLFLGSSLKSGFPVYLDFDTKPESWRDENYLDLNDFQYTAVKDLDNDGTNEIVTLLPAIKVPSKNLYKSPVIKVFNPSGKLKWEQRVASSASSVNLREHSQDSVFTIGDINGDGRQEIFFYSYTRKGNGGVIEGFSHDGKPLIGWPLFLPNNVEKSYANLVMADLNGDGKEELLMHSPTVLPNNQARERLVIINNEKKLIFSEPSVGSCRSFITPSIEFDVNVIPAAYSLITVGDFDKTSSGKEVVFRGGCGELVGVKANGSLMTGWPRFFGDSLVGSPIAVDVESDGREEIAFKYSLVSGEYNTESFKISEVADLITGSGVSLPGWPLSLPADEFDLTGGQPAAADLDNDGKKELVFTTGDGPDESISVLRSNGNFFPGWPKKFRKDWGEVGSNSGSRATMGAVVADINNDKRLDIVISIGGIAYDGPIEDRYEEKAGGVFAFNADGSRIDLNPHPNIFSLVMGADYYRLDAISFPPLITDLDRDGFLDVISTNSLESSHRDDIDLTNSKERAGIYAFSMKGIVGAGRVAWPQLYGNPGVSNRAIVDASLIPKPTATPIPYNPGAIRGKLSSLLALTTSAKSPPRKDSERNVFENIKREVRVLEGDISLFASRLPRVGREAFVQVFSRIKKDLELMDSLKNARDSKGNFFRINIRFIAAQNRAKADLQLLINALSGVIA